MVPDLSDRGLLYLVRKFPLIETFMVGKSVELTSVGIAYVSAVMVAVIGVAATGAGVAIAVSGPFGLSLCPCSSTGADSVCLCARSGGWGATGRHCSSCPS